MANVKLLDRGTLQDLLAMYEAAIHELEDMDDRDADGLLRRLERHRAEVIAALATKNSAPDE